MKLGKIFILVGLIAVGTLSLNFQALAGNPPVNPPVTGDTEYWGVIIIACASNEAYLRVKRVVDCQVETDSLIERYPLPICSISDGQGGEREIIAGDLLNQWSGYDGVFFQQPGVPMITKVKNFHKKVYEGGDSEYNGDIFSADVQIRFCSTCAPTSP